MQLGNANALQNTTLTLNVNNGLTFSAGISAPNIGALAGFGNVSLQDQAGAPAAVTASVGGNNASTTYSGTLSGLGGLTKTGNGIMTISTASTYNGATSITGGTLRLLGLGALPNISGLLYQLDASNPANYTLSGANVTTWNDNSGNGNIATYVARGSSTAGPTVLSGGSGINGLAVLHFNGTQELTLSNSTTPESVFIVNRVTNYNGNLDGIWGQVGDYGIRMTGGPAWANPGNANDYSNPGVMYLNGAQQSGNGAVTIGTAQLLEATNASPPAFAQTGLGEYGTGAAGNRYFTGDIGEVIAFSGVLTTAQRQAVEAYLDFKWFGTVTPGFSGTNLLPTTTAVSLSNSSTLDLAGSAQAIASLAAGDANEHVALGGGTLTIGGSSSTTYAGVISDTGGLFSATGGQLVIAGTGALTLSGANTYSGGTTVNSGALLAANSSGSAVGTGAVTVQTGGSLGGSGALGTLSNPVAVSTVSTGLTSVTNGHIAPGYGLSGTNVATLAINGTLTLAAGTFLDYRLGNTITAGGTANDLTTVSGLLSLPSSGQLNITAINGNLAPGTYTLISAGSISDPSGVADWKIGNNTDSQSTGRGYTISVMGNSLDLTVTPAGLTWTGYDGGASPSDTIWSSTNTNQNWALGSSPSQYFEGAQVAFNDSNAVTGGPAPTGTVVISGTVSPSAVIFANHVVSYTLSGGAAAIGGASTTVTLSGNASVGGIVSFTGITSNTYGGATTINNGSTLIVSADAQLGTGAGAGNIVLGSDSNGGTLRLTGGGSISLNGGASGGGAGRGIYLGPTSGSGSGTIDVAGGTNVTAPGAIVNNPNSPGTGTGSLIVASSGAGGGTLILAGTNSYSGSTTINSGATLQIGNASFTATLGGGAVTVNSSYTPNTGYTSGTGQGGLVFFNVPGGSPTVSNVIGGSGSLVVANATAVTLAPPSANGYGGGTFIVNGTLQLGNNNALPSGTAVTFGAVSANGTLDLNGYNATVGGLAIEPGAAASSQLITNSNDFPANTLSTLTFAGTGTSTYGGSFSENSAFTTFSQIALNVTSGTLVLTGGSNQYSGGTAVGAASGTATLALGNGSSGSATGIGVVNVNNRGVLTTTGSGATIAPGVNPVTSAASSVNINNGGTLSIAAASPLTISNANGNGVLSFSSGATLSFALPTSGPSGVLISTSTLNPASSGSVTVNILNSGSLSLAGGQIYDLINYATGPAAAGPATTVANFALATGAPAGFSWQLQTTGSQLDLVISANTSTTTASRVAAITAGNPSIIHVPGGLGASSTSLTLTLTNTGGAAADSIDYSGQDLTVSATNPGGRNYTLTGNNPVPLSGTGLAHGNSVSGTATFSSVAGNVGTFTIAPVTDSPSGYLRNHTSSTAITPSDTNTTVQVNYYAQPAFTLSNGSAGSNLSGALTVSGASYTLTLNVPTTTGNSASLALANSLLDSTFQDTLGGTFTFTGAAGSYLSPSTTLNGGTLTAINPDGTNSGAQPLTLTYANTVSASGTQAAGSIAYSPTSANAAGSTNLSGITITLQVESLSQTNLTSYNATGAASGGAFGTGITWSVQNNATSGGANSYAGLRSQVSGQSTGGAGAANGYGPLLQSTTQDAQGNVGSGASLYAQILAGSNSGLYTAGAPATVAMAWRNRTLQESSPLEGGMPASPPLQYVGSYLISNVLSLSGMTNTSGEPVQTDPFVLQMNYDTMLLSDEAGQAKKGTIYLGWLNPNASGGATWQKAFTGDFDSSGHQTGAAANGPDVGTAGLNYQGSFLDFVNSVVAAEHGTNGNPFFGDSAFTSGTISSLSSAQLSDILGAYGVDPSSGNHDVWAVINHNSQFAVVPEPSTLLLAALGLAGLAGYRVRRRRK